MEEDKGFLILSQKSETINENNTEFIKGKLKTYVATDILKGKKNIHFIEKR